MATIGETRTDSEGNKFMQLPHGLEISYTDDSDYLSKLLFFGPLVSDVFEVLGNITIGAIGLIGATAWGLRRNARRFRKQVDALVEKMAGIMPGADPEATKSIPTYYWPDDIRANEAAKESAQAVMARAEAGAKEAAGLLKTPHQS